MRKYAPLPASSLVYLVRLLRYGAPHLQKETQLALRARCASRSRVPRSTASSGTGRADESPQSRRWTLDDRLRLLAPFDPIVWDRRRFELLWGWTYRFEAYTPEHKRTLGYYALPMLWGDASSAGPTRPCATGARIETGFPDKPGRSAAFKRAFEAERARLAEFLGLSS